MTMLKAIVVFMLIGILLLVSRCSGQGERHLVNGIASGGNIFASSEMKPVTVNFINPMQPSNPIISVALPRAFVIAFDPYTSKSYGGEESYTALPDDMKGHGPLWIAYLHPKGDPYTHAPGTFSERETGPVDSSFGKGFSTLKLEQQKRWLMGHAKIYLLHQRWIDEGFDTTRKLIACQDKAGCLFIPKGSERLGDEYGLASFKAKQGTMHYYFSSGGKDAWIAQCFGAEEKSHPQFFCKYIFPLNDKLFAQLEFLDFRLHGGPDFARARIRAFKRAFCGYFKCDDRALAAAGLQ